MEGAKEKKPQATSKNPALVWKMNASRITEKRHKSANHLSRRTSEFDKEFSKAANSEKDRENPKANHESGLAYLMEARRKLQRVIISL